MDNAVSGKRIDVKTAAFKAVAFAGGLIAGACELKGGVYPFALCVMCAYDGFAFPVFAGAFTASVLTAGGNYVLTAAIMAVYAVKWIYSKKKKTLGAAARTAMAGCGAMFTALGELMSGNLIFEDIPRSFAVFAAIPLLTLGLCGRTLRKGLFAKAGKETASLICSYIGVKAMSIFSFGYFDMRLIVGAAVTMFFARSGFAFGGICGFVCGMAAGMEYMPMMGLLGFCYGMFCDTSKKFAPVFAFALSAAVSAYLIGVPDSLPPIACALAGTLLFLLLRNKLPQPKFLGCVNETAAKELPRLSAAFSSLSQAFRSVGQDGLKIKKHVLGDNVRENVTSLCAKCRGCDCKSADLACTLTETVTSRGLVMFSDLPKYIQGKCVKTGELLYAVNSVITGSADTAEKGLRNFADEYLAFSRLICSAEHKNSDADKRDYGRDRRVRELLRDKGVKFTSAAVRGERRLRLTVTGIEPDKLSVTPKELTYMLSALLTRRMSEPEIVYGEGAAELRMTSLPAFRIECAKAMLNKDGESVCGDTVSFFENADGYFYSLISDGMGSGREAELSSRLAAILFEKLLSIGAEPPETLDMLNRLLISRGDEVFTTVDLLEIDRVNGDARLIKAGAPPTFVYRGDECYRLEAQTPPVGIINEVKAAQTKMKLRKGDFIVMTSDGLSPGVPKPPLPQVTSAGARRTAANLAGAILESWSADSKTADDMSVCVVRVY